MADPPVHIVVERSRVTLTMVTTLTDPKAYPAEALLAIHDKSALQILGAPDDLKLASSMTLFALASGSEPVFQQVLDTPGAEEALQHPALKPLLERAAD